MHVVCTWKIKTYIHGEQIRLHSSLADTEAFCLGTLDFALLISCQLSTISISEHLPSLYLRAVYTG